MRPNAASRWVSAGVLVAVLALAGCGSDDSPSTSGTTTTTAGATGTSSSTAAAASSPPENPATTVATDTNLCRMVTKSEAEAVLGTAVGDGIMSASEGPLGLVGSCRYRATNDTAPAVRSVVNIVIVGTRVTVAQFDEQLAADAPDAEAVAGVGDKALLIQEGILAVFDGGAAITVQALHDGTPLNRSILVDLAKKALDRL